MIPYDKLMESLITGRYECYVRKNSGYNPYHKSERYDWAFERKIGNLLFTDSYRGVNPYGGVEYLYEDGRGEPSWSCDYVGYVRRDAGIPAESVYAFLKEARGSHLKSCGGVLLSDYQYENGPFRYETVFEGGAASLLQTENICYEDRLVARQLSSGRTRQ